MRKITEEAIDAFYNKKDFKKSNTKIVVENDNCKLLLHNNKIAELDFNNNLYISLANWNTRTTRERLNGLNNVHIRKYKNNLLLNGQKWDGKFILIENYDKR